MRAKEWLNRGWRIEKEIEILQQEKAEAFARVTEISCANKDVQVMESKQNGTENKLVHYLDYSAKLDKRLEALYKVKQEIHAAIAEVQNPVFRQLLELRYLQFKKWEEIAEIMKYSDKWLRTRLHSQALAEIEKNI